MIQLAKKAKEIVQEFKNSVSIFEEVHANAKAYFIAEGYLAGLQGPEVKALVSALSQIAELNYLRIQPAEEIANEAIAQYREAIKP